MEIYSQNIFLVLVFRRNGPIGKSMYTTTSFSIIVDRIAGEPFKPKRVLNGVILSRHIFPLGNLVDLFILWQKCLEIWKRHWSFKKRPKIHNLMFADDYIIFCECNRKVSMTVKAIFDHCNVSCQPVNYNKPIIQF